ncbi:hypothetical protein CGH00_22875 [Vibrio parahaemolyticus]|nr:hypothetical protein CGH00_22875 [Vibrio parahaemolyticus]
MLNIVRNLWFKTLKPNGQLPSLKLTRDVRWIEEKYAKVPYLTAFKLAKYTGFGLKQQLQRNLALTKSPQR